MLKRVVAEVGVGRRHSAVLSGVTVLSYLPLQVPRTDRRGASEGSLIQGRRRSSGQVDHDAPNVREIGGQVRRQNFGVVRVEIAQLKGLNPLKQGVRGFELNSERNATRQSPPL